MTTKSILGVSHRRTLAQSICLYTYCFNCSFKRLVLLNMLQTDTEPVMLFLSVCTVVLNVYSACRLELPIPYKLPPDQYLRTDKPWCVDGNYSGVDSLGQNIDDPVESFYGHVQSPD